MPSSNSSTSNKMPSARFDLQFDQAITTLQSRIPHLRDDEFHALGERKHHVAFTVARVAQLDVIQDVQNALDRALQDGVSFADFKKSVGPKLEAAWGGARPHHLETIWRTNLQVSYNAGRYKQLTSPVMLAARPIWVYDAILDTRTTPICNHLHGTALPAMDEFWQTHWPPLHHRCRSSVRSMRAGQVRLPREIPADEAASGFGLPPLPAPAGPTLSQTIAGSSPPGLAVDEVIWQPDVTAYPNPYRAMLERALEQAPPLPKPIATAENVLAKKIGAQAGSNPGGLFEGADGIKRYVKFYDDPGQAHGEHLANELYRLLGHGAPESLVFEHQGKHVFASTILEGSKPIGQAITKKQALAVLDGFATDVLTANWDAVGLNLDNIVTLPGGQLARIDQGGAFLMRAKAGRKAPVLLEQISEWAGFQDSGLNPAYSSIWAKAGVTGPSAMANKLVTQIKKIQALEKNLGGWGAWVDASIPALNATDRHAITSMLEARSKLLGEQRKALEKLIRENRAAQRASKAVKLDQHVVFEYDRAKTWINQLSANRTNAAWLKANFAPLYDLPDPMAGAPVGAFSRGRATLFEGIRKFTGGYKHSTFQRKLYRAWLKAGRGAHHDLSDDVEYAVAYSRTTRRDRWQKLAELSGLPGAPTHIRAYRGSRDALFVEDVLAGWHSGQPTMQVRQYAMASWGMSEKAAKSFSGESLAVIFKHDFPLEHTFADQLVDDSTFVSVFMHEAEVIAGVGSDERIMANVQDQVVFIGGKRYAFAERDEALRAYRSTINRAFDPSQARPKITPEP